MKITKAQEKDLIVYTIKTNNATHSFAHPIQIKIDPLDIINILLDMVDKHKQIVNMTPDSGSTFIYPPDYFRSPSIPNYYNHPITCSNPLNNDTLS